MSSPSVAPHSGLRWRKLYEAAVLELDQQLLLRRIDLARKAIKLRVERLICTGESAETERLIDAINVLDDLRKMQARGAKKRAEH
jgi:hypothetical protein